MQIQFSDTSPADTSLIAYIANKDDLPTRLERAIVEGAAAARFKGSPGQFFEGFVEREDKVVRVALAGAGNPDAEPHRREEALEKAGAVLAAKYLTSGERDLVLDFASSDLDAAGAASVLLGLRLRSWRHDAYRTKLKDEQKKSLSQVTVVNAPAGTEGAWEDAAAVAEGTEFSRHLAAEPPNKLYPVSFVELCKERFSGTGAELIVLDFRHLTSIDSTCPRRA